MTRGDIYKKLPAFCTSWYDVKLAPALRAQGGTQRSQREARTLSEIMDILLGGDVLQGLMVGLGRLNAVTDVATSEGVSWAVASHHELASTDSIGLVTARSRANQAADQRELLRTQGYVRGAALQTAGS